MTDTPKLSEVEREQMLHQWRGLVLKLAREFHAAHRWRLDSRGIDRDDCEQVALMTAWRASAAFDRERGGSFPAMLRVCVRNELHRLLLARPLAQLADGCDVAQLLPDHVEAADVGAYVRRQLAAGLDDADRRVLERHALGGESAAVLYPQLSRPAARRQVVLLLERCRELLADAG